MLSELTASTRRLALVGLAKNTGKTEALAALLRELQDAGRRVGVTSVGRDGEERDVIDARIEKPRVRLPAGSLVATTDGLLRASGIPHELLEDTGVRTPLGRVLIARLRGAGAIEVAGPSAATDVRAVADAMLAHGAEQVLIDGAIDRRAASSPDVADGLIMSTGAVLDRDIDEVVLQTRDAVDLVRLPSVEDAFHTAAEDERLALPPRFALTAEAEQIAQLLDENPAARWLVVAGALPDRFLRSLVHPVHRRGRELALVVSDPTRVFLWKRGPEWYRRQGILLKTLKRIELEALTVNPIAPQSHRFDSAQLRALLEEAIPDVPVFDVLHADYRGASAVR
ncbi:MAG: hypothetical protein ACLPUT_15520 [Solirubrobacteraceae bacterium]